MFYVKITTSSGYTNSYNCNKIKSNKNKKTAPNWSCFAIYYILFFLTAIVVNLKQLHNCVNSLEVVVAEVINRYTSLRAVAHKLDLSGEQTLHIVYKGFQFEEAAP